MTLNDYLKKSFSFVFFSLTKMNYGHTKKCLQIVFICGCILLSRATSTNAQNTDTVYIHSGSDTLVVANLDLKDTLSIFGNVINQNIFASMSGSYIYFFGKSWQNSPSAKLPGISTSVSPSSKGGIFNFFNLKLSPLDTQYVSGGYSARTQSGPAFPYLQIQNPANVYLEATDLGVLNSIHFSTGKIFLRNKAEIHSIGLGGGEQTPRFTGYNRNSFIVTGSSAQLDTGFVYLYDITPGDSAVWPIGTSIYDYTPIGLINFNGVKVGYSGRVFDNVYSNGGSGAIITDDSYIKKTWWVSPLDLQSSINRIKIQHHRNTAPMRFNNSWRNSFITTYKPGIGWDTLNPITPVSRVSIYPNIGNDGDSVFYNWRMLNAILNSQSGFYFTKRILTLSQIDSLVFNKQLIAAPELVASNGSYNIGYRFIIGNNDPIRAKTDVIITDNLRRTFPSPITVSISALRSINGHLLINPAFDGINDTVIIKNATIPPSTFDTVILVVNVDLRSSRDTIFGNLGLSEYVSSSGLLVRQSTDTAWVRIKKINIVIPDGFTPNGDGINDRFVIIHSSTQAIGLTVFNRWGSVVYKSDNYANDWDGRGVNNFLGKNLEDGTYYIYVQIKDIVSGTTNTVVKFITIKR